MKFSKDFIEKISFLVLFQLFKKNIFLPQSKCIGDLKQCIRGITKQKDTIMVDMETWALLMKRLPIER